MTGHTDAPGLTQSNTVVAGGHMEWNAASACGSFTAGDLDNSEADGLTLHTWPGGPEVKPDGVGGYTVAGKYGTYTITPDTDTDGRTTFAWTYELNPGLPDYNGEYTDTVPLRVSDGHGGFARQEVSVDLSGTNTAPVLTVPTVTEVWEDAA